MTEMSVALCPFSPWLIDMGGPQETPVGDTQVHRAWREVHLDGNPLSRSAWEATCSEPVGAARASVVVAGNWDPRVQVRSGP